MYIIHVANKEEYEKEIRTGFYGRRSVERCGFIHCSDLDTYYLVAPNFRNDPDEKESQEGQLFGWTFYDDPKLNEKYGCDGFISFGYDPQTGLFHFNCDKTPIIDRSGIPVR